MPCTRVCRLRRVLAVEKRKLNPITSRARDDVAGAGARVDVRDLPASSAGNIRCRGPIRVAASSAMRRRDVVHRVAREVRIGDVALDAFDDELAESEPRRPFLIMSPSASTAGRLADDAVVELLAARLQRLDHSHRAVDGGAFLVGREQQARSSRRDPGCAATNSSAATTMPRSRSSCRPRRGRTAAVADRRHERVARPLLRAGPCGTTSVWPANTSAAPARAARAPTGW